MIFFKDERISYFHVSHQHKVSLAICLVGVILRQYLVLDLGLIQLYAVKFRVF